MLIESSGLYGKGVVQTLNSKTFEPIMITNIKSQYFGEGSALYQNEELHLLTWQERKVVVYSLPELNFLREFDLPD